MKKIFYIAITPFLFFSQLFPKEKQDNIRISFEQSFNHKLIKGKAGLIDDGYKGKALRLLPETEVSIPVELQSGSQYVVQAFLKTSSGTDNILSLIHI